MKKSLEALGVLLCLAMLAHPALAANGAPHWLDSKPFGGMTTLAQSKTPAKPAPPANGQPQRFETTVYKSWRVTCGSVAPKPGAKPEQQCSAVMQLRDQRSGRVIFGWVLRKDAKRQLVATIQVPTGGISLQNVGVLQAISVQKGVKIAVGKTEQVLPYTACAPALCESVATLEGNLQRALMKPETVAVTFYASNGRDITFNFKQDGIDQAINAILH